MAIGRRKLKKIARRGVALVFTLLILAQNAWIPRSRADVVDVELGQKKFVIWVYCDNMQDWKAIAGNDPYYRIMMINESNFFFNGTKDDEKIVVKKSAEHASDIEYNCGYNVQNSDFPGKQQVSRNETFITESGMNTPYIYTKYEDFFVSVPGNYTIDKTSPPSWLNTWNIYLSDNQDGRSNYSLFELRENGRSWYTAKGSNRFFYYVPGGTKSWIRGLQGTGTSWSIKELEINQTPDWSNPKDPRNNYGTPMKVYVGKEKAVDAITSNFTVEYDQIAVLGRKMEYVNPGVTITVKSGGVLTIDGTLLNDGKIVVEEGGLMVIKSNAVVMPLFLDKSDRGGITSRGNIVIRSGGVMIGGGANGVYLSGGTVTNLGVMASENFTVKRDYTIENKSDGKVYMGKTIDGTIFDRILTDIYDGKLGNSFKVSDITTGTLRNWLSNHTVDVTSNPVYGNTKDVHFVDNPLIRIYEFKKRDDDNWVVGDLLFSAYRNQISDVSRRRGGGSYTLTFTVGNETYVTDRDMHGTFDWGKGEEELFSRVSTYDFNVSMLDNYDNPLIRIYRANDKLLFSAYRSQISGVSKRRSHTQPLTVIFKVDNETYDTYETIRGTFDRGEGEEELFSRVSISGFEESMLDNYKNK